MSKSTSSGASLFPFVTSAVYKEVQDLLDARVRFEEGIRELLKVRDLFVANLSFTLVQKTKTGRDTLEGLRADTHALVNAIARSSEKSSTLPSSALAPLVVLRESVHVIFDVKTDADAAATQSAGRVRWICSCSGREELPREIRLVVHEAEDDRVESVPCCDFCAEGNASSEQAFASASLQSQQTDAFRLRMTAAAVSMTWN